MGLFDILPTLKGEKKAFPPPSPLCNVVPLFELPVENNKHPNFEWGGGGAVWILLFPEYNFSTIFSLIVDQQSEVSVYANNLQQHYQLYSGS